MITKTPHYWPNRLGQSIEAIIIHRTDGSFSSAINWIKDPQSRCSYHAIIRNDGHIENILPDEFTAWHAGTVKNPTWSKIKENINPNTYTLGVALSGKADEPITLEQFLSLCAYIKEKCQKYTIPIDNESVIPHNYIRRDKSCPGPAVSIDSALFVAKLDKMGK